jgi:hypothetical protein
MAKASSFTESTSDASSSDIIVRNEKGEYIERVPSLPVSENEATIDEDSQKAEGMEPVYTYSALVSQISQ